MVILTERVARPWEEYMLYAICMLIVGLNISKNSKFAGGSLSPPSISAFNDSLTTLKSLYIQNWNLTIKTLISSCAICTLTPAKFSSESTFSRFGVSMMQICLRVWNQLYPCWLSSMNFLINFLKVKQICIMKQERTD